MKSVYDPTTNRVDFLDERFYWGGQDKSGQDIWYPSVTHVLNCLPKGKHFYDWLKDVGHNADLIAERAATVGTNVHDAIEFFLNGNDVHWVDAEGNGKYTQEEWNMILRFHDFYTEFHPKPLSVEENLVSHKHGVGGTIDLPCEIDGERYIIDHKTSKSIHDSHKIQLAIYLSMWNENYPDTPIDNTGILWLRSSHRGRDKKGKSMQGRGWKLVIPEHDWEYYLDIWTHVKAIYDFLYPNDGPKNYKYETSITHK